MKSVSLLSQSWKKIERKLLTFSIQADGDSCSLRTSARWRFIDGDCASGFTWRDRPPVPERPTAPANRRRRSSDSGAYLLVHWSISIRPPKNVSVKPAGSSQHVHQTHQLWLLIGCRWKRWPTDQEPYSVRCLKSRVLSSEFLFQ